jgi:hypothetical protein
MTPGIPTPIVEEIQQTTLVGMDIDVLEEGQGQLDEDAGNQFHPENPKEDVRANGMDPNQEETIAMERSHNHRREQWKMSLTN